MARAIRFNSARQAENQLRFELDGLAAYSAHIQAISRRLMSARHPALENEPPTLAVISADDPRQLNVPSLDWFGCALPGPKVRSKNQGVQRKILKEHTDTVRHSAKLWEDAVLELVEHCFKLRKSVLLPRLSDRSAFQNKLKKLCRRHGSVFVDLD